MRLSLCLLAPLAILAGPPASAQTIAQPDTPASGADFLTIGLGGAIIPDHEGSNENRLLPIPGAVGRIGGFGILYVGNRLSVDLLRDGRSRWDLQLGPAVSIGLNRTNPSGIDDPRIRALGKVDAAVELGGFAGIARWGVLTSAYDRLSLSATLRHDVAKGHGGTIVTPAISYIAPLSKAVLVGLVASANHADDDYAGSYYTVTPGQSAASTLPVFNARGGWRDWSLGAAANVSLSGDMRKGLSVIGGISYTRLLNDFADSPVVSVAGKADQWMAGLGLAYTF